MKKNKNLNTEIIPPSFDPSKTLYDWSPENTNWDDPTVCALCGKVDCICTIQKCKCKKDATKCKWPSDNCPCLSCDKLIKNCKCKSNNKGESQ